MIVEVPEYNASAGITYAWRDNFAIEAKIDGPAIYIRANTAGLLSLANHLLNLAQENVPNGCHIHLDEGNSLEAGSCEIVIAKHESF